MERFAPNFEGDDSIGRGAADGLLQPWWLMGR